MRIGDDQQVELLDALLRLRHARHGVAAVTHDEHGLADCPSAATWSFGSSVASNQRVDGMPGVFIDVSSSSKRDCSQS